MLSKWQENSLIIDGSKRDWENNLKYFKEQKVAVGITNDNQNLYLCLVVSGNARIMNLLRAGLTTWFKPQNSDGETFGIQYPIHNSTPVIKDFGKYSNETDFEKRQKEIQNKLLIEQNEFLVLNEDNYPLYASPLKGENGIEVRIGLEFNQLVYELKIPLNGGKESLLKMNTASHDEIKIGFISGHIEKPEKRPGSMGMSPGNQRGMGMGGGRRGGMNSGHQHQMGNSSLQAINLWINTVIATK